ncbi:MAG: TonB-dependent receptor [Bacteroidota bacterium]
MKKEIILFLLFSIPLLSFAQNDKFTISGRMTDASNGEDLIGATVVVADAESTGAMTNIYGFYSLTLEAGKYQLIYQYLGYQTQAVDVELKADMTLDIELATNARELQEVVVMAEREDQNITDNQGSVTRLDVKEIENVPVLFGERDVLKVVQLNPGIKSAGEGNSGFYVRGGGLDQNLILLDEAPVYNPSHLLGFFSVFNSDALKNVTVFKGGMAAEYGGRTSSVMDIRMKDGNSKEFSAEGGIGTIASRLTLEAPIVKDKGSFMISGRRTYADLFLGLSSNESINSSKLYFYDLNLKANYQITEKDRIFLSGYFGRDNFGFGEDFGFNWGNATGTLRWNHLFSNKLFSNTSLIYSNYDYEFSFGTGEDIIGLGSVIEDFNIKQDFTYFPNDRNTIKFGANLIDHEIQPGNLIAGANSGFTAEDVDPKHALEGALYIQNDQKVNDRLSLNYGLRHSLFDYQGAGTAFEFDENGGILSQTEYEKGESIQFYHGLEPRLSANYLLNNKSSLKLGYNRNYQYIHLLTNATSSTPTDVWIPSSNNIRPQIADQVSLGYFRNFKDNMFETSVEVYYKDMQNVIDYRNGANLFFNDEIEGDLVYGDGRAFGAEFYVKKTKGKLTGWVSYTLSRTLRQFDEINNGEEFPARQDRIHDIAIVALYDLSPTLKLSANWVFNTGDAITFPSGRYEVDGKIVPYYTERNGYRMPNYHRMDLGLTWITKKTERFEGSWNFSLYNTYGRENAYSIDFQSSEGDANQTEAVQLSLFRWVPSVTYNFKF